MKLIVSLAWLFTAIAVCLIMANGILKLDESVSELDLASTELLREVTLLERDIKAYEALIAATPKVIVCGEEDELED